MWLQLGLASGAAVIVLAVFRMFASRRKSSRQIDVGAVSESWLAEQRARRNDSL